jgi:hypothetical protein
MIRNNIVVFILLLLTQMVNGQIGLGKEIHGKISVDSLAVDRVNVVNSANGKATVSDQNGFFSIFVKEGDVLVFSAVSLETLRKKINKQDLVLNRIRVQVTPKSIVLKEIVINEHPEITAENFGIIPYGQKKYSPAERKLKTAGDFKPIHLLGLLGGSLAVDPIINKINGRTSMLKKELEVEGKEAGLRQLENMFGTSYFVDKLKILPDYINGFQYYLVESDRFVKILQSKNKTNIEFVMGDFAIQYNKLLADDKK